jgi:hypothetical protein
VIKRIVPLLRKQGFKRGVMGTDSRWLVVWAVVSLGSMARKRSKKSTLVYRTTLKPDQRLAISILPAEGAPGTPT